MNESVKYEYLKNIEPELDRMGREIDKALLEFDTGIRNKESDKTREILEALQKKQRLMIQKAREVKQGGDEAFKEFQAGVNQAWNEMSAALARTGGGKNK